MTEKITRREALRRSIMGLAALGASTLILPDHVQATPGDDDSHPGLIQDSQGNKGKHPLPPGKFSPTEDNIEGPYFRSGAYFRSKVSPPLAQGQTILIQGRVWGYNTRRPLKNALIDIWHASHHGRYDNDDPNKPPKSDEFLFRSRLITDEQGRYEYETILPGRYKLDSTSMRPRHIHYRVAQPGYQTLITQLYFKGDPHNKNDQFIKSSLIIDLHKTQGGTGTYLKGTFDIVLAPAKKSKNRGF